MKAKTYIFYCPLWNCTVKSKCYCKREAIATIRRHLSLTDGDSLTQIGVNL